MRYLMLTITAIGLMSCSFLPGDKDVAPNDVPSVVKNTLSNAFPDAMDVDWEMKKDDYEADFEVDNVDYSVLITTTGDIVMQKHDIALAELPEAVKANVAKDFKDRELEDVEKVEKEGTVYYQVDLDGTFTDKELVYTANGEQADNVSYWD